MAEAVLHRQSLLQRSFRLDARNLGNRVISGASFQFLGIALRTAITIGSTAILARLLAPADFGYVAMAMVVTELAALFSNFGFTNLLIQRRSITRLQVDTVFWASVLLGAALALVVFLASFATGLVFADPRVGELLRVLCLTFLFSGVSCVSSVVLARLMRFRTEFWIQMVTVASRTLVAIGFAYAGYGAWSLVAGAIASVLIQAILGFVAVPYRPRLRFHAKYLQSTWRTSGSYFGTGLQYYLNMNLDLLLIGRQLGAAPLGIYQNARSFTDEIRARIAIPLQHVLFPAFSALQFDPERMRVAVVRSARLMAALVIPIGLGVSAAADELVPVLYGPKWLAMVPIMTMFGISAAIRASTAISGPLYSACDRVGLALKYNVLGSGLLMAGVIVALPFGLEVVAAAIAVISLFSLVTFRVAIGLIGLGMPAMLQILGPPSLAGAVMWAAIEASRPFISVAVPAVAMRLLIHVAEGAAIYLAVLHALSRTYLADFDDLAKRLLRRG